MLKKPLPCRECGQLTRFSFICYQCAKKEIADFMKKSEKRKVNMAWVKKFTVVGTSGKKYTLAQDENGNFGCDCPAWKMQKKELWVKGRRRDCNHILQHKISLMQKGGAVIQDAEPVVEGVTRGIKFDD
jgi:hypothetical protein